MYFTQNGKTFNFVVLINGHTSANRKANTPEFNFDRINFELSEKRAEEVKLVLMKYGVPEALIESRGFGDAIPIIPDNLQSEKNQRVEIILKQKEVPIQVSGRFYTAVFDADKVRFTDLSAPQINESIFLDEFLFVNDIFPSLIALHSSQRILMDKLLEKICMTIKITNRKVIIEVVDPSKTMDNIQDEVKILSLFFKSKGFEENQLRVTSGSADENGRGFKVYFKD